MKALLFISFLFFFSSNISGQYLAFDGPGAPVHSGTGSFYQDDLNHLEYKVDSLYTSDSQESAGQVILAMVLGHIQKEDYNRALHSIGEALTLYKQANHKKGQGDVYYIMGVIYERQGKYNLGIKYLQRSSELFEENKHKAGLGNSLKKLGDIYAKIEDHLQAVKYYLEALQSLEGDKIGQAHLEIGRAYKTLGDTSQALHHFNQLLSLNKLQDKKYLKADAYNHIGAIHLEQDAYDSALFYLELAYSLAMKSGQLTHLRSISKNLHTLHEKQLEHEKALAYYKVFKHTGDSLKRQQIQTRAMQIRNDHAFEMEILHYQNMLKKEHLFLLLSLLGLAFAALFIFTLIRDYQKKKQAFVVLQEKNDEILKTRNQMIAQEKMAALGQLAAGIAHEIKNPLNFVNNFAEGSIELIEDLVDELEKRNLDAQQPDSEELWEVIYNIKQNSTDISRNGKRANQIVNNIMEYARGNGGKFQAVDINLLIEKNLNLALPSSNTFDVVIQKDLDPAIGLVEVIPQDLGRVILNLINNAFFALKKKRESTPSFTPTLQLSTSASNEQLTIHIRDNGTGIPTEIQSKVFMPFYTSKPTGNGNTGLGLSISYEIVVNRHKGSLELVSEPGIFTEFILRLPMVRR